MLKWSDAIALALVLAPLWYLLHLTPMGKVLEEELYEYKGD